jgi:YbbR domain-containing protein
MGRAPARRSPTPVPLPPAPRGPERSPIAGWLHSALFENLGLKFLSMVLAVTVFLLVNTDKDRQVPAHVGVSYTLPDDRVLVSDRLDELQIEIKGPWRKLRRFDEHQLDRVNLDLRNTTTGEIAITPDMIHLPSGLTLLSITPRTMRVQFDRRIEKVVEVLPALSTPPHGFIVTGIKSVPATVKLRGAESVLAAMTTVTTREISLDHRTDPFSEETDIVPPKGVDLESSQKVSVAIHIDEKLITRNLPNQQVSVRGDNIDPAKWAVAPTTVNVTLTGAELAVEDAKISPIVRFAPGEGKAREAVVVISGLPPGIGVKVSPERVTVSPVR